MDSIVTYATHSNNIINKTSHYHDCHQIIYIKNGTIEIKLNGKKHNISNHSLIIINRFEEHSIKQISENYDRYSIRINPNLNDFFDDDGKFVRHILINRPDSFNNVFDMGKYENEMNYLFEKICTEYSSDYPLKHEITKNLLKQIFLYILRKDDFLRQFVNKDDFVITEKICRDFEMNYGNTYSLKSLAANFYISESRLAHIFKNNTGMSIMNYLLACRITAAKNLLSKSNLSISEISEKCGFSDMSNFCRTFKRKAGMTPREFKNKFKK